MRKKNREVTDFSEKVEIMRHCDVCRLDLTDESGYPYILPLNFGLRVDGETVTLIFHSATEGTKLDLIAKDPRASFEMDCKHRLEYNEEKGYCTMNYESVIGHGTIHMLSEEEKLAALEDIMRQYHPENISFNHAAIPRTAVYVLTVEDMTGKRKESKIKE